MGYAEATLRIRTELGRRGVSALRRAKWWLTTSRDRSHAGVQVLGQATFLANAWGELGEAAFYFTARAALLRCAPEKSVYTYP